MLLTTLLIVWSTALVLGIGERPLYSVDRAQEYFEEFIHKYDRQYVDKEERDKRFEIFKINMNEINERNSDPSETAEFGITNFADMTIEEILPAKYEGDLPENENFARVYHDVNKDEKPPKTWDWRETGLVSSVKNQGNCSASYLFALLGEFEITYGAFHNKSVELSAQQMIDCIGPYGDPCKYIFTPWHACSDMDTKLFVYNAGVELSQDYPYEGKQGQCRYDSSKEQAKLISTLFFNAGEEEAITFPVWKFSLALSIDASSLQHYVGGILRNCTYKSFNHNVHCVGYGTENGVDYWIMKNSWGTEFGEKGYFRVARRVNACGLFKNELISVLPYEP